MGLLRYTFFSYLVEVEDEGRNLPILSIYSIGEARPPWRIGPM